MTDPSISSIPAPSEDASAHCNWMKVWNRHTKGKKKHYTDMMWKATSLSLIFSLRHIELLILIRWLMPILMYTQIVQRLIHITMVKFKYPNVIQTKLHINTCIMKIHGCHNIMNISQFDSELRSKWELVAPRDIYGEVAYTYSNNTYLVIRAVWVS